MPKLIYKFVSGFGSIRLQIHYIMKSVFCFFLNSKIAKLEKGRKSSHKDAHACRISAPRQGVSISDKAWERTVYYLLGVWRCLEFNNQ